MTNKQRDYACSVLFLIFGIFMFIQSLSIHSMMDKDVGSGFVPKIVAMAIIVISAIKLLLTFLSKKSEEAKKSDEDIMGGLLTIVLLAIYVVLFKPLGFILSTFIYLVEYGKEPQLNSVWHHLRSSAGSDLRTVCVCH